MIRLRDIKITTRLRFNLGIMLGLILILVAVSFIETARLWKIEKTLYDHPYQVGKAVRDVQNNVLEIHRKMKDIAIDNRLSREMLDEYTLSIDSLEVSVMKQFNIIQERYLGPRSNIDSSLEYFRKWKPVRDKLINFRKEGELKSVQALYYTVNKPFVERMLAEIRKMIIFSNAKGESLFKEAQAKVKLLNIYLLILTVLIVIIAGTVTYFTIRAIRRPLKELLEVTRRFGRGDYTSRSSNASSNELGQLASTFNSMADTVQRELSVKELIAEISGELSKDYELEPFSLKVVKLLMNLTGSQTAVIYLLDKNNNVFIPYKSAGLEHQNLRNYSVSDLEGEPGRLILSGNISRTGEIPEDLPVVWSAVQAGFRPAEIITIPVSESHKVVAFISLSSIRPYSDDTFALIQGTWHILSARMVNVLNYQRIIDISVKLDSQNRDLNDKSRELMMQTDELKEYNIELETQKRQIEQANSLKSIFLSNMSHELRTPLNSVIALSGLLSKKLEGRIDEEVHKYLKIIEKNGKNLLTLINDILDLSRIESGKEEILLSEFEVTGLLGEITSSLEPVAREKGISIIFSHNDGQVPVISDRAKCYHILQNIIANAVKFTEKGYVKVTYGISDKYLKIIIRDTGIGIREDFMPYIFDEFRQSEDQSSRRFGGTGLGLAIAKKYCDLLGGNITVRSKLNEGSEFEVTLPAGPDVDLSGSVSINKVVKNSSYSKVGEHESEKTKKVLVVEDSEPQMLQICDILKEEGVEILQAVNGEEALSVIRNIIPDLMLLDLQMPGVDGFAVLKKIREDGALAGMPVIIISAKHLSKADLAQLKGNNIHQYIQKGNIDRKELVKYIRSVLETSVPVSTGLKITGNPAIQKKILVIEDNNDNLTTFTALLGEFYNIISASAGEEGINKAIVEVPDLILLDISLPGMDGFKVFGELRKNSKVSHIPVVALTARAMKNDMQDLISYGFDGYISKPVDFDSFSYTVRQYLKI